MNECIYELMLMNIIGHFIYLICEKNEWMNEW